MNEEAKIRLLFCGHPTRETADPDDVAIVKEYLRDSGTRKTVVDDLKSAGYSDKTALAIFFHARDELVNSGEFRPDDNRFLPQTAKLP